MSEFSHIEWTDATWNPLLGCDKCSEGCKLCYAIRTAWRLQHNPNPTIAKAYEGLVEKRPDGSLNWTGRINLIPERLREPMGWAKPRRIFVNSQSDLFHPEVPDDYIDQVFAVMAICTRHTFQILTKRPERMKEYLLDPWRLDRIYDHWHSFTGSAREAQGWPLPNVWLGTSVENQKAADSRIPHLVDTPAAVRFLSCEPLLGPVDPCFTNGLVHGEDAADYRVDWVIVGGESGQNARPMNPDWARSLRDQCQAAGVPFFFKQFGEYAQCIKTAGGIVPYSPEEWARVERGEYTAQLSLERIGKKAAGRMLDGREWSEFPKVETEVAA